MKKMLILGALLFTSQSFAKDGNVDCGNSKCYCVVDNCSTTGNGQDWAGDEDLRGQCMVCDDEGVTCNKDNGSCSTSVVVKKSLIISKKPYNYYRGNTSSSRSYRSTRPSRSSYRRN